jgi:hypothetical protein
MAILTVPGVAYTPSATKTPTPQNYMSGTDFNFTNQYLPDTEKIIHKRYGNQRITGMLEYLGKESAFASDNFKWSEDGRLTLLGTGVTRAAEVFTLANHTFRVNETVIVRDAAGTVERQGIITAVTPTTFTAKCSLVADWTAVGTTALTVYAYGAQFQKGTKGMQESLNSQVSFFENTPIIIKEMVKENGSNMTGLTWLEVSDGKGNSGFVWYFKNREDTEIRFENKIESELILAVKNEAGSPAFVAGFQGTQGLYSAMREGNIFGGPISTLSDVDEIVDRFNKQGFLSQYYLYSTTAQSAAISDFLKDEMTNALSWGAFNNKEDMALHLEFKGFHRSGYEFYTSRSRFLDDPLGQGSNVGANKVHGLLIPSGSKQVYDHTNSTSANMPILHTKYRAGGAGNNRKYQMAVRDWVSGKNEFDELKVEFQGERMLVLAGRNNTLIAQG